VVQYSMWTPDPSPTLSGMVEGTWGTWTDLPRPYVVSKTKAPTRALTSGGDEYIKALSLYCSTRLVPENLAPTTRSCRIRISNSVLLGVPQFAADDVFRVMEIRTWEEVSDHAEIACTRDLGEAQVQA
jgi:hypothetical protein